MIKIKTIASSSAGCCYVVDFGKEKVLIDAGVNWKRILKEVDYNPDFSFCLISHDHGDHAKYSKQVENAGIPIYCTDKTAQKWGLKLSNPLDTGFIKSGLLTVVPMRMTHDTECYGFIIMGNRESVVYITDTGVCPYQIEGLTHVMIEANHSFELLLSSDLDRKTVGRISETHLDIDQAIQFCANHKETLKEIHLLHLSDRHSDEALFKKQMAMATGIPVYVAKR